MALLILYHGLPFRAILKEISLKYEKTITGLSTGSGNYNNCGSFTSSNVAEVINAWGIMKGSSTNRAISGNTFGGNHNEYFDIWIDGNSIFCCSDGEHRNKEWTLIVQYTKSSS